MTFNGYIFPETTLSTNLLGLADLCNKGCDIALTAETIDVRKDDQTIWSGTKATNEKSWHLDLEDIKTTPIAEPNATFDKSAAFQSVPPLNCFSEAFQTIRHDTNAEFVKFIHAVFASCPISTLQYAMDHGWLGNLPKLTSLMLRQNPPVTRATAMAYLDQSRQGVQSTRKRLRKNHRAKYGDPPMDAANLTHIIDDSADPNLCFQVLSVDEWRNSSDATGKFPFSTMSGWNYILVSTLKGYVHMELLRDRSAAEYRRAYVAMYAFYELHGKTPTTQRLDNESSNDLETFLKESKVKIEYVTPGIHRQNPSERAIRHAKNCIIAMCQTADPLFPANLLFEEVVAQAEIVLNQIRPWHDDPTINAWTGLHNQQYDHLAHPLSVFAMRVVVQEKPHLRPSWAVHGKDGFYLGPALNHYRCWRIYCPDTGGTRISDSIAWLPEPYRMPGSSPLEMLTAITTDLVTVLRAATPTDKLLLSAQLDGQPAVAGHLRTAVQLLGDMYTAPVTQTHPDVPPGFSPPTTPVTVTNASPTPAPEQRVAPSIRTTPHDRVDAQPPATDERVAPQQQRTVTFPTPVAPVVPVQHPHQEPGLYLPPYQPSAPMYDWGPVSDRLIKGRQRRYLLRVNKLFKDKEGPQCIVDIERNHANTTGPGSQTLFYRYYNIIDHMTPPTNHNDYDHIPCAELLSDPTITWTTASATAQAMSASSSADIMNLNLDGSPLTHASALKGPNEPVWRRADDTEHRKLTTETGTMHVISKNDIPADRRKDVAYYITRKSRRNTKTANGYAESVAQ